MGADGIAYLRRYLEANAAFGKQLGKVLLDNLDFSQGEAWAFVPDPIPDDRKVDLADFETGGLFRRLGQQWRQEVMGWISGKVGAEPHVLCVEDGLARPSDPFVASWTAGASSVRRASSSALSCLPRKMSQIALVAPPGIQTLRSSYQPRQPCLPSGRPSARMRSQA